MEEARLIVVDLNLDVLTYAPKELPLMHAVSNLVIPALVDQLYSLKKIILPHLLMEHPKVRLSFKKKYLLSNTIYIPAKIPHNEMRCF